MPGDTIRYSLFCSFLLIELTLARGITCRAHSGFWLPLSYSCVIYSIRGPSWRQSPVDEGRVALSLKKVNILPSYVKFLRLVHIC